MTTTKTPAVSQTAAPKTGSTEPRSPAKAAIVTLDELAKEMKTSPRDARMLLRLAAKQAKLYPHLGKEHVARQPWQWTLGSKALEEARKALASTPDTQ